MSRIDGAQACPGTPVSVSVVVLVLDDGVDAVVWSLEKLERIVTAINAGFGHHSQMIKQGAARLLNGFQSRRDVVGQKADRSAALAMTPGAIGRSRTVNLK
jgi:hypothetical protein